MRIRRIAKFVLVVVATLVLLLVLAVALLPWQRVVQQKLIATLEAKGIKPAVLTVEGIGVHGIQLKDVALGTPAVTLQTLSVGYAPLALLQRKTDAEVTLRTQHFALQLGTQPLTVGEVKLTLTPQGSWQQWRGNWAVSDLVLAGDPAPIPALAGGGTLSFDRNALQLEGALQSADASHQAAFEVHYALQGDTPSVATIRQAQLPWGGGMIRVNKTPIALNGNAPIALTLQVQKVALQPLMEVLAGGKATASGVVSGSLPLTFSRQGQVRVGKSLLTADAPGIITLAPELIPGDNPQVALVRNVLSNLHYQVLSLALEMQGDSMLGAELLVEGNNPQEQGGRPVKLKVHLSGDVLNLMTQNITLMKDPQKFIQQGEHD